MAAVNSGPSPRAGRTQGRVERGAGMPAGLPALAAPLAALAGMARVRSASFSPLTLPTIRSFFFFVVAVSLY